MRLRETGSGGKQGKKVFDNVEKLKVLAVPNRVLSSEEVKSYKNPSEKLLLDVRTALFARNF